MCEKIDDIFQGSSNMAGAFVGEWVLSASAGDTGSYSVPAATHLISANAHETQKPLPYYGIDKRTTDYLTHIRLTFLQQNATLDENKR